MDIKSRTNCSTWLSKGTPGVLMQYLAAFPFKTFFICGLNDLPDLLDERLPLTFQNKPAFNLVMEIQKLTQYTE